MEHVSLCLVCNRKNKRADGFDPGFGSEVGQSYLCFPLLKGE